VPPPVAPQQVYFNDGAVRFVEPVLQRLGARSVLLVTGKSSFTQSGAEAALAGVLSGFRVTRFTEFQPNPQFRDALVGIERCRETQPDVLLAVGGGSAIDTAKLIAGLADQDADPNDILVGAAQITRPGPPLIAVPTTAGSGSEATHFAVVYRDGTKYSVTHESLLPHTAIVDPCLTHSLSAHTTAVTGLDAFAQAVESVWSVNSTDESRHHARRAVALVVENLCGCVSRPTAETRRAMSEAAHLAGRAINVTRTTAPHALSYVMTSSFGVPHGHAVALTLGQMLVYNSRLTDSDVLDPRGADHVRRAIGDLNGLLGCETSEQARDWITQLIESVGLATRLSDVGIRSDADRRLIRDGINVERLANNPRRLTPAAVDELLRAVS
jgi:alcohol dehydrogenase class IV